LYEHRLPRVSRFFWSSQGKKLQKRLGPSGLLGLLRLWAYSAKVRSDGDLNGMDEESIELAAEWDGEDGAFCTALVDIGFLDAAENDGYLLHDWAENNPWAAEEKERQERARTNATAGWAKRKNRHLHDSGNAAVMPQQSDGNATAKHLHDSGNAKDDSGNAPSPSPKPNSKIVA
jgi:hypothetical protein